MLLNEAKIGSTLLISELLEGIPSNARSKLLSMGFIPGTKIKYIRRAPIKGRMLLEVRNSMTILDDRIAKFIGVEYD